MFPSVTLVMLLYKSRHIKDQIIATLSLFDHIVVVDNASEDGLIDELECHFPQGRFIRSASNQGFGAGNNLGLRAVTTEYCLVANPDAQFDASTVQEALSLHHQFDRVGVVGGRVFLDSGEEKASFDWNYDPRHARPFAPLEGAVCAKWIYGCFMLFQLDAIRRAGYFDERFFLYYEEWDVCRRLQERGFSVLASPQVVVRHTDGLSSQPTFHTRFRREYHWLRSKRLFLRKFPDRHYRAKPRWLLAIHGTVATIFFALLFRKTALIKALARARVGFTG